MDLSSSRGEELLRSDCFFEPRWVKGAGAGEWKRAGGKELSTLDDGALVGAGDGHVDLTRVP